MMSTTTMTTTMMIMIINDDDGGDDDDDDDDFFGNRRASHAPQWQRFTVSSRLALHLPHVLHTGCITNESEQNARCIEFLTAGPNAPQLSHI